MRTRPSRLATVLAALLAGRDLLAREFFVSPAATARGDGSRSAPWTLAKALSQPAVVKPGDTIWLRGGTYVGEFRSRLKGTAQAPIVVRQYPGERATLDGNVNPSVLGDHVEVLTIQSGESAYAWFWGFEVMNSNPNRYNPTPGSNPPDQRGGGIYANAVGTKLINLIVHDTGVGIGFWSSATESEAYGNIVYYNGWTAPDRGHGHSIYTQNLKGTKTIKHNVLFSPFDYNVHAYGSSSSAFVNVRVEGNVWLRGGSLIGGSSGYSLSGTQVVGNYQWDSSTAVGYYSKNCNPLTVTGNYWVNVDVVHPTSVMTAPYDPLGRVGFTLTSNTLVGALDGFTASDYPNNTYYTNASPPNVNKVVVLPNAYEAGRATVVVYNWQNLASVTVDLTGVVSPGTLYEIRNAQNYYGPVVASGTYSGGSVTLPMTGLTPATPVGFAAPAPTGPRFNAFVVLPGVSESRRP